jgi:hypothetical protein
MVNAGVLTRAVQEQLADAESHFLASTRGLGQDSSATQRPGFSLLRDLAVRAPGSRHGASARP